MAESSKKAQGVCLLAVSLSMLFFAGTLALGVYIQVRAVYLICWQALAGGMVWLSLLIQFYQRRLAEQEKLDIAQMQRARAADTIFQGGGERTAMFEVAQKRLILLEKWFIPIAGVVIAVYEITIGLMLSGGAGIMEWKPQNPLLGAALMVLISFVSFLISRFATGMSTEQLWRPLRAGGSYLLATSLLGFATAAALAFAQFKYLIGLKIIEVLIPWLLVVLGVEILLNALLDIYRPRVAGQYGRSAFDSRLLGLINEPEGFLRTVASTIDYQFGFEVSQTWFYRLLEKAILPLFLFLVATLYLLSSIVIVGPGYGAIIEHFGRPDSAGGGRLVGPGIKLKWPWPIEKVYQYPTELVQKINIGFVDDREEGTKRALLWGKEHYKHEYDLLVATSTDQAEDKEQDKQTVPVSLIRATVPVHYKIKDLYDYIYRHVDAREMLEAICYRELTRFAASASIETQQDPDSAVGQASILGRGRLEAANELARRIQGSADAAGLGVEIVFLGLEGIHPPPKVAEDYQNVTAAVQARQAQVLRAIAERAKTLTELAGSSEQDVEKLYELAVKYTQQKETLDPEQSRLLREKLLESLSQAKGRVFRTLRDAQSRAFERVALAEASGVRFGGRLKAYQANPDYYLRLQRLLMLEETLAKMRKYVVVANESDTQVYIIDLMDKLATDLYKMDVGSVLQESR